jgi:hypothetical protein
MVAKDNKMFPGVTHALSNKLRMAGINNSMENCRGTSWVGGANSCSMKVKKERKLTFRRSPTKVSRLVRCGC